MCGSCVHCYDTQTDSIGTWSLGRGEYLKMVIDLHEECDRFGERFMRQRNTVRYDM